MAKSLHQRHHVPLCVKDSLGPGIIYDAPGLLQNFCNSLRHLLTAVCRIVIIALGWNVTIALGWIVTIALGWIVTIALGWIVTIALGWIVTIALGWIVTIALGWIVTIALGWIVTIALGWIVTIALGWIVTIALGWIVTIALGWIVTIALGWNVTIALGWNVTIALGWNVIIALGWIVTIAACWIAIAKPQNPGLGINHTPQGHNNLAEESCHHNDLSLPPPQHSIVFTDLLDDCFPIRSGPLFKSNLVLLVALSLKRKLFDGDFVLMGCVCCLAVFAQG
ncbi:hypothetical protein CDAR_309871 [Caerostris darwini]|uniref:Uncharacterized protein n=1 Tax=Caerostris darwini TaxID=1538125 RepID=A0AAV4W0D0_9ARAC|nr:hypothetical protein CDAR_309871 [Caerostris darwini]